MDPKQLERIELMLVRIDKKIKKPSWLSTSLSFVFLSFGLLMFNISGENILQRIIKILHLSDLELNIISICSIMLSLLIYRR